MNKTTSSQVAETMIDQIREGFAQRINIGGTEFRADFFKMTGAKDLVYDENMLMFKVPSTDKFNKIKITLNEMDTYDIEFWITGTIDRDPYVIMDKVNEIKDVYCDELGEILARECGLIGANS